MIKKSIKVKGMSCQHCIKSIEIEMKELELNSLKIELGNVEVEYDPILTSEEMIINAIQEAGFEIEK